MGNLGQQSYSGLGDSGVTFGGRSLGGIRPAPFPGSLLLGTKCGPQAAEQRHLGTCSRSKISDPPKSCGDGKSRARPSSLLHSPASHSPARWLWRTSALGNWVTSTLSALIHCESVTQWVLCLGADRDSGEAPCEHIQAQTVVSGTCVDWRKVFKNQNPCVSHPRKTHRAFLYVGVSREEISHRFPFSSMKKLVILGTLKSRVMSWDLKPAKQDGIKSHWALENVPLSRYQ